MNKLKDAKQTMTMKQINSASTLTHDHEADQSAYTDLNQTRMMQDRVTKAKETMSNMSQPEQQH